MLNRLLRAGVRKHVSAETCTIHLPHSRCIISLPLMPFTWLNKSSSSFPIPCYLPVSGSSVHLLNPFLSFANLSISLIVFPFCLPSSSITSSHVLLGRPLPLFPIGLAPYICLAFLSSAILITCPYHCSCLLFYLLFFSYCYVSHSVPFTLSCCSSKKSHFCSDLIINTFKFDVFLCLWWMRLWNYDL